MKNILTPIFFFIVQFSIFAQSTYDIYFPTTDRDSKCNYFLQAFKQKPKEVKFGIKKEGNNLYFEITDKQWFDFLFKNSGDGIAIDIVSKERYSCSKTQENVQIRGTLLPPVYLKQLKRGLKRVVQNRHKTLVGTIPKILQDKEIEFNILFLNDKSLCNYYSIYNLESYPWDLLDMGIYLDDLVYKNQKVSTSKEKSVTKYKTLKFSVPFKKNKAEYLPKDIKPMYDSLKLTDFNIKKINIKAYASVEGSLERNVQLQEQRANSIATSLKSFQKPNIETTISSSENWVEFLTDIKNTNHKNLIPLSKKQIKAKLVGNYAKQLEPILTKHRKAVIELFLEKKDKYKEMTVEQLVPIFNDAIKKDDLEEATNIQNSILNKVKEKLSPDALNQMNIPKQKKYIALLTKNSMIKHLVDIKLTLIVYNELEELKKFDLANKKINYNLMVLKLILWKHNALKVKPAELQNEITGLKKFGITQNLIDRMLVNFHIVKADKDLRNRDYDAKDESIDFINDTYENFNLSNYDYLSLAQFLTYYSNKYDAIDLLEDKVKQITVDEDLLFYYLNLTLVNSSLTKTPAYRSTMLNAINMNKERFCKLFNSSLNGGVTFQLLENIDLKVTYCENCAK